jgi:uncharacterized membrane protein
MEESSGSNRAVPSIRLALWAVLIPLTYLPQFAANVRPSNLVLGLLAAATAVAALSVLLLLKTSVLDRAAARLNPFSGWILAGAIVAYIVVSSVIARARLDDFGTYDQLGIFSQSYWNLLHGHGFANTGESMDGSLVSHFGIHFSPTLLLLVPFYSLWPTPLTLLIGQAAAVALATVPLYRLVRRDVGGAAALVLALMLLAVPNFAFAGIRDFHDANFLPVFLLGAFWALENRRWGWFVAMAIGALGVREEMGITIAMLAAYALVRRYGLKTALGIAALGLVWMAFAIRVVMPRFWSPGIWIDPARFFTDMLGQWGANPVQAAWAMMTHPADLFRALVNGDTIRYVYHFLTPFLILPPLTDIAWLIGLPGLALNMLSRLAWMRDAALYYSIAPITFAALGAVRVAARTAKRAAEPRRAATGLATAILMLAGAAPWLSLSTRSIESPAPPPGAASAVVRLVPAGVPVYGPVSLYPKLGNREYFGCWSALRWPGHSAEVRGRYGYIVLWPAADPPDLPHDGALADSLAHDSRFTEIRGYAPFVVFQRSSESRRTP